VRSEPPQFRWSDTGTRFLLYPQSRVVPGFGMPRVVRLPSRPGAVRAGPEDRRIRVVETVCCRLGLVDPDQGEDQSMLGETIIVCA